jgi:hypothetical protein
MLALATLFSACGGAADTKSILKAALIAELPVS